MTDGELTAALDVLVDRCDEEHGDWAEVRRRAGLAVMPPSRRRATPRRIGLVALAAVLLGGVALVATGFARDALSLLGRIEVDFWSSDPAPDVVRWRFEDLAIGAPPEFAPQVDAIASEARTVGNLRANGKLRTIWVAPTRSGGFCYEVENLTGGCTPAVLPGSSPSPMVSLSVRSGPIAPGAVSVMSLQGIVVSDEVERLTIEFADGASEDLDFVFVSTPIDAGFFAYTVPTERQSGPGRPRLVVARNGAGEVVASQRLPSLDIPITQRPPTPRRPSEQRHRARPSPAPSAPVQRGEAHGVLVTAGSNGSVLFDLRGIAPGRRAMLENGLHYSCFELVMRGGVPHSRGLGVSGDLQPTAGFRFNGLRTPFDGCYLLGYYGHRWPGKLDNHYVVEVSFTQAGRRHFEDRAAARDLALFARSPATFRLRKHPPPLTADELRRQFGTRIAALPSRAALPPRGMIGYWVDGSSVLLRRVSSSGRRLELVIGPTGGITSENIRYLTRVE